MSTTASALKGQGTGLRFWGFLVFLGFLVLAINTYSTTEYIDDERLAVSKVTEVQVLSQQISKFAAEAAAGNLDAFDELKATRNQINTNVTQLQNGSPSQGMPAYKGVAGVAKPLDDMAKAWTPVMTAADTIVERQELVLQMSETAADFNSKIPRLTQGMEEISRVLQERDAPGSQVYMATRQMLLADRMLRQVSNILKGGELAMSAADQFGRDAKLYGQVLDGLMNGNATLNIRALNDPVARGILDQVFGLYNEIGQSVDQIQSASTDLFDVTEAADSISIDSQELLKKSQVLAGAFAQLPGTRPFPNVWLSILGGGLGEVHRGRLGFLGGSGHLHGGLVDGGYQ